MPARWRCGVLVWAGIIKDKLVGLFRLVDGPQLSDLLLVFGRHLRAVVQEEVDINQEKHDFHAG